MNGKEQKRLAAYYQRQCPANQVSAEGVTFALDNNSILSLPTSVLLQFTCLALRTGTQRGWLLWFETGLLSLR